MFVIPMTYTDRASNVLRKGEFDGKAVNDDEEKDYEKQPSTGVH